MSQPDQGSEVTILGAGIVGICTALSLLERGVRVRILDRAAPGQETSFGNAGVVSPFSCIPQAMPGIWKTIPKLMLTQGRPVSVSPAYAFKMLPWGLRFLNQSRRVKALANADAMSALCGPTIDLFEKHLRGTGHEGLLVESIYVQAFRDGTKASLDTLESQIRQSKGADLELIGRDALGRLEPDLSPEFSAAVLVKGTARVLSPGRVGAVLAEKARTMGAVFETTDIRRVSRAANGWNIHCSDKTRSAERVVVCLGAWSRNVMPDLPHTIPLISERGFHAEFASPGVALNNTVMDVDGKFIVSSMENGVRVAGHAEFAPPNAPISERRTRVLMRSAKAALPGLNTKDVSFWVGSRPSFPDSLPMIGGVEGQEGLFLNFGHSHYGLMMSPASGELVAQMVCGHVPNTDTRPFSMTRFG